MTNERLQVLKMVEDGKITVDEATKLLESLQATCFDSASFEEKFSSFAANANEFFKEAGCKLSAAFKEAEPKVKEITKTVVAKTASLADNISQSLHDKIKDLECCEEEGCCNCGCDDEEQMPCDCSEDDCRCN